MIVLTRTECTQARIVVKEALEHKELDGPNGAMLLTVIDDAIDRILAHPGVYIDTHA